MKILMQKCLAHCARRVVARERPFVIGITGSYGKTSMRNAITSMLVANGFSVATPNGNYNNEWGFPLGILGFGSPGRSATGWLAVLLGAIGRAYGKSADYPKYLVLEYGADHPGDIKKLCAIAKPRMAVMTGVSSIHAEFLGSLDDVAREKSTLAKAVPEDGCVFVTADDNMAGQLVTGAVAPVERYGYDVSADVQVREEQLTIKPDANFLPGDVFATTTLTVTSKTQTYFIELKNLIGKPVGSMVAGAIIVAEKLGLLSGQIDRGLSNMTAVPGRLHLLPGIRGTLVIDDTYNAAPAAMQAALQTLLLFPVVGEARRIAVLGHMAELGPYHEKEHAAVGKLVADLGMDVLLTVGEKARDIARAAKAAGMEAGKIEEFETPHDAGRWLDRHIRQGDVVLVKGAQSARMEKVVKEIMAEPLRARELLVRQYGSWLES